MVRIGLDAGFQATGVAITEVRDASREENGQGGGVRRLALNRCLLPLLSLCLRGHIVCGFLTNWIFPRSSLSGAEESNEAGRNGNILHLSSAIHVCDTSSSYMAIDQCNTRRDAGKADDLRE